MNAKPMSFHDRMIAADPELAVMVELARRDLHVAQQIYDLRTSRNLTKRQLADLAGTSPAVITRLEDANYDGPSVTMLDRIAAALDATVHIEFVPGRLAKAAGNLPRRRRAPIAAGRGRKPKQSA